MSIKRLIATGLAAALLWPAAPLGAQPRPPNVTCRSCLVLDDDGEQLWARRPGAFRPNASTTKMLTALVVRRELNEDATEVTVPSSVTAVTGGRLDLEPGERLSVRELLYALLMVSSNHAAIALAEAVSGSEARFTDLMNDLASELGARDTRMTTAHGLDAPGHGSTAADLAVIAEALLEDPVLAGIVSTPRAAVRSDRRLIELENTNELLEGYRGLVGVKTGFTLRAGNVLVAAAERQGRRVMAVAMGSQDAFSDAAALLDHGFAELRRGVILGAGDSVGALVFDPAGSLAIAAGESLRGLPRPEEVELDLVPLDVLGGPLERGDVVGRVTLRREGRLVGTVPAVAAEHLPRASFGWPTRALSACLRWAARLPGLG